MFDGDGPRAAVRLAAAAAAVGGLIWWMNRQRKPSEIEEAELDEEIAKLLPILDELGKSLFFDCTDIAATTKAVHDKIDASNPGIADQLKELWQTRVFERLQKTQADVTARFGCTLEEVVALQERHMGHERVGAHIEGCTAMMYDALAGVLPLLPGAAATEGLTEDKVVEILIESYKLEEKKVKKAMHRARGKQQQVTVQDFDAICTVAKKDATEQALGKAMPELTGRREVFLSALALYLRSSDAFVKRKTKVDDASKPRWDSLFGKPGSGHGSKSKATGAAAAAAVAGQLAAMGLTAP